MSAHFYSKLLIFAHLSAHSTQYCSFLLISSYSSAQFNQNCSDLKGGIQYVYLAIVYEGTVRVTLQWDDSLGLPIYLLVLFGPDIQTMEECSNSLALALNLMVLETA